MIISTRFAIMTGASLAVGLLAAGMANATTINNTVATITDTSTAPSGTVIASNLPSSGIVDSSWASPNLNYYTNNYSAFPGQSFTTGASDYSLTQIAIYDYNKGNASGDTAHLDLGTVGVGNTYTLTNQYTGTVPTLTTGDYLVFTLGTPLTLAANTNYIFGVYDDSSDYMGVGLVTTGGSAEQQLTTLDGGFFSGGNPNLTGSFLTWTGSDGSSASSTGTAGTDNSVFEVIGTTIVPEPASLGLMCFAAVGLLLIGRRGTWCR